MSCSHHFSDYLVECPEGIKVNIQLPNGPYTEYTWVITDKFQKQYSGEVTSDGDGHFLIPVDDLPPGLLNPHSGEFSLSVYEVGDLCKKIRFLAAKEYEEIRFEVKGGTRVKDNLGCVV